MTISCSLNISDISVWVI